MKELLLLISILFAFNVNAQTKKSIQLDSFNVIYNSDSGSISFGSYPINGTIIYKNNNYYTYNNGWHILPNENYIDSVSNLTAYNGLIISNDSITFNSDVYSNTFGGDFKNNTFSGDVYSNTFSGVLSSNTFTFTIDLRYTNFNSEILNKTITDTLYPFLFGTNYKKEIIQASNGNVYVKYFDGTNDVNILIP